MAWLLELVLPTHCVVCGVHGMPLCDACRVSLQAVGSVLCARCGAPTAWPVSACRECSGRRLAFTTARAGVRYTGSARTFVRAWKEHGLRRLAPLAADLVTAQVPRPAVDVITYVPGDGRRSRERGHHPARELALELGERWQLPVGELLRRTRPVARQTGLSRADRSRNVRGAFAARGTVPASIALVDDVYTTGATVDAAAGALRRTGAAVVHVVTYARAVR